MQLMDWWRIHSLTQDTASGYGTHSVTQSIWISQEAVGPGQGEQIYKRQCVAIA